MYFMKGILKCSLFLIFSPVILITGLLVMIYDLISYLGGASYDLNSPTMDDYARFIAKLWKLL